MEVMYASGSLLIGHLYFTSEVTLSSETKILVYSDHSPLLLATCDWSIRYILHSLHRRAINFGTQELSGYSKTVIPLYRLAQTDGSASKDTSTVGLKWLN